MTADMTVEVHSSGARSILASVLLTGVLASVCGAGCSRGSSEEPSLQRFNDDRYGLVTVFRDTLPICESCKLTFTSEVAFGTATDAILMRRLGMFERHPNGSLIAYAPRVSDHEILVYDEDTTVLSIGQSGSGPGEFNSVVGVAIGPRDSTFILHDGVRISVFDPNLRYVRTYTSPVLLSGAAVALSSGAMIVAGGLPTAALSGVPLHYLDRGGQLMRSFGTEGIIQTRGTPRRVLTAGDNGTIWAAEPGNYRIEQLSHDGIVMRTILIRPPSSWSTRAFLTPIEHDSVLSELPAVNITDLLLARPDRLPVAPRFRIASMIDDQDGHLWVAANVPARDWQSIELRYANRGEGVALADDLTSKLYRTVVDVISIDTGELIGRGEIDGVAQLMRGRSLVRPSYATDGVIQVEVLSLGMNGWQF